MFDSKCSSVLAEYIYIYQRIRTLTFHKKLLADLAELLHGCFGQILVVESTFEPFVDIGILSEPRWPRPRWLLALRHVSKLETNGKSCESVLCTDR